MRTAGRLADLNEHAWAADTTREPNGARLRLSSVRKVGRDSTPRAKMGRIAEIPEVGGLHHRTSESQPERAHNSWDDFSVACPVCVGKRDQRMDSFQSQSSLALEEASAPFDLYEWSFW